MQKSYTPKKKGGFYHKGKNKEKIYELYLTLPVGAPIEKLGNTIGGCIVGNLSVWGITGMVGVPVEKLTYSK